MAEDFDVVNNLSFRVEEEHTDAYAGRRQSFRTASGGVRVRVHGALDSFAVNDISAGGVCIGTSAEMYPGGEILTLDILVMGKRYLNNLAAMVVRADERECACAFQDLTRHQELKLDKLVLEMQKRSIAQRKQQREAAQAAEERKLAEQAKSVSESGSLATIRLS